MLCQVCNFHFPYFTAEGVILPPLSDVNSVYVGLWMLACWTIAGLLLLNLLMVCVQAGRSTIEISKDSLNITLPLKLLHHQPLTKTWIIRFIFLAQYIDCTEDRLVKVTPLKQTCCSFPRWELM